MTLKESLKLFSTVFSRQEINMGTLNYNDILVDSNESIEQVYELLSFNQALTIGGEMFITIKADLAKAQEGWYLIKNKQGEWEKNDASWNKDWIVFADRSGDAIFYDKESKTIKGTINGKIFFPLSPSLATFFQVLSECMILEEEKYDFITRDEEEDELLPDYLDDISSVLERNLDEDYQQGYMQFFFG
ncbi:hypothetical protein V9L05_23995 (plasmid) [Bernardetia sp. Wsw4-3y2]|uniref:hypothetical protein n=1 Tax=Bernardetia sp. Wsw4-3y2 TaxID=3127471 RepID=UPI0030D460B6